MGEGYVAPPSQIIEGPAPPSSYAYEAKSAYPAQGLHYMLTGFSNKNKNINDKIDLVSLVDRKLVKARPAPPSQQFYSWPSQGGSSVLFLW